MISEFISDMQGWFNIHRAINWLHHTKKLKNEKQMIISRDLEIAFFKIIFNILLRITKLSEKWVQRLHTLT